MAADSICVYCSSSNRIEASFVEAARALGAEMARRGHRLIFGGASLGLMGQVALAAHESGGRVVGVTIEMFSGQAETIFSLAGEPIVLADLRERKAALESHADAFIALPGGLGTLDEVFDILARKQLKLHDKPFIFLNTNGFYDTLLTFMGELQARHFTQEDTHHLYYVAADAQDALDYIERYEASGIGDKKF